MKSLLFLTAYLCLAITSFSQSNPSTNIIVADYEARITQNSSTISSSDKNAISVFVAAAIEHGYWDKLLDISPIAGNNFNAAFVKLKNLAGTPSVIGNNGFAASDYAPEKGLQLGSSKSLNSNVNLSTLNLQGLFGFSMWLKGGVTTWMGSPNNNIPYSLLMGRPVSFEAYVGFPPTYVTISSKCPSSMNEFYHLIKQSLNSTKVFVNGQQVGATNPTVTTTQLRNADVEVFRDAGNVGKGQFYSIDNGTMTDSEAKQFYLDVRQLMYGLGRKIAPPVISADGLYTNAQQVTIALAPTNSSLAGAAIHYTTDGSLPSAASPVYTAPLTIASSTHIQAIAIKNGETSLPASSWVAIVPVGFNTTKYYTAHVMINLLSFTLNMTEWLTTMKASGYNLIWAHLDDYTDDAGKYITTLKKLMDAAEAIGGIQVMPGASWWVPPASVSKMFRDTWNHPALFRIGGKRVYSGWDYQTDNQPVIDNLLAQQNITKDQYYLWVTSRFPYSYDEGNTWVGEHISTSGSGYLDFNLSSLAGQEMNVARLYQTRPQLDGLINFAVDQFSKGNTIKTNTLITKSSIQQGKFSMGGVNAFYASASYTDFGFKGAAEIWDSILALPANARPTAMSDITANDYNELSYMSPMVIPPTNGLSYIPPFASGFTLGDMVRYPLTDHSGIQKFLRPWADAFLNNQPAAVFTQERMFAWYWLHPKDQAPNPVLPSVFSGYPHLNQQWWNNSVYATGSINAGGVNQVQGMKTYIGASMEKIRMAAHLTAPARLRINDSVSELKPAGAAFYEIEMGTFRGTPTFAIVREGVDVKSGTGLQPIVNNVFPGGWNFLATEIVSVVPPATTSYYQSKSSGSWSSLSTWQSSADSLMWYDALTIPSSTVNTITIRSGHTVIITDTLTVDQLIIKDGGALNVLPNASIIVKDGTGNDITIETTGKMNIQSNATGTGRIGNSSGNISGNVTVERYISAVNNKSYRLLSPSVNTVNGIKPFIRDNWQEGQNNTSSTNNNAVARYGVHITGSATGANGFDATVTASPSLFTYDTSSTNPAWFKVPNTNATSFEAQKGYLIFIGGDRSININNNNSSSNTTLRATGSIASGTQNFANQASNGKSSLVTNPYACPVNWSLIYNDLSLSNRLNFENFYNYWDPNIGTSGGYVTVNVNGTRNAVTNATVEIQSGQAFFVRAKPGIISPTFTIKESHKSITSNRDVFRVGALQAQFITTLYFSTNDGSRIMADAVNAIFDTAFSARVDKNDAEEMANSDENIAIKREGKLLSIEGRPLIKTTDTLPLTVQRLKVQNYEWQFNPENFNRPNLQAYLEDNYLNLRTAISIATVTVVSFSVNSDLASAAQDRFHIVFGNAVIQPETIHSLKAYQQGTGIQVDWEAVYDFNVEKYEVEKSVNGQDFTKTNTVYMHPSSSLTNAYAWFDANPFEGDNFYRIKEVNKTGIVHYSGIANVNIKTKKEVLEVFPEVWIEGKKESFKVFPNPITGNYVTIQFNNVISGLYRVNVANVNGQIVFTKTINHAGGSASQSITVNTNLPAGSYNLQISGNGTLFNQRIVKQN